MFDTVPGLLKEKQLSGAALLAISIAEYGTECFEWEPEILRAELSDDFGIPLTDSQSNKLQAAITLLTTDHFEHDWHSFNVIVHSLNGEPHDYDTFEPVDAEQIAAAMPEVNIIRNQFCEGDTSFGDEVNVYAGLIFSEYGLLFAPNIVSSAVMPVLQGEHDSSSQTEKHEALNEIYTLKKQQVETYLNRVKSAYTV